MLLLQPHCSYQGSHLKIFSPDFPSFPEFVTSSQTMYLTHFSSISCGLFLHLESVHNKNNKILANLSAKHIRMRILKYFSNWESSCQNDNIFFESFLSLSATNPLPLSAVIFVHDF